MFGGFRALSANFTPTPNQFFDEVLGHYPARVVTVVGVLIRATLGWEDPDTGERRVEAELPLSAFLRPDLCENSARKGLAEAIAAGLVVRTAPASSREGARYALRWEDGAAQARALERSRRAAGGQRPLVREAGRGAKSGPLPTPLGGAQFGGPKNAPPYRERKSRSKKEKKEQTLNVGEDTFDFVSAPELTAQDGLAVGTTSSAMPSAWLDRQAAALVAELGDRGSERRHRQLLSLCEEHGLSDLPGLALHATRERLAREGRGGVVGKPGAYYCRVLLSLLAERQVFIPTAAEQGEDDPEAVRRLARASLGMGASRD